MPGTKTGVVKGHETKRARRRATVIEHAYTLDTSTLLLLKQTNEKCTIAIRQLHNLLVEVSELRATVKTSHTLFLALLNDPQARHEIEAVARDLRIETYKKE